MGPEDFLRSHMSHLQTHDGACRSSRSLAPTISCTIKKMLSLGNKYLFIHKVLENDRCKGADELQRLSMLQTFNFLATPLQCASISHLLVWV